MNYETTRLAVGGVSYYTIEVETEVEAKSCRAEVKFSQFSNFHLFII